MKTKRQNYGALQIDAIRKRSVTGLQNQLKHEDEMIAIINQRAHGAVS